MSSKETEFIIFYFVPISPPKEKYISLSPGVFVMMCLDRMVSCVQVNDQPRVDVGGPEVVAPLARRRMRKQGEPADGNPGEDAQAVIKLPVNPEAPGEGGVPVKLPSNMSREQKMRYDIGWQNNAFNQYVSDMISLRRGLPDMRHEG